MPVRQGPSVRVTRGKETERVPVGAAKISAVTGVIKDGRADGTSLPAAIGPVAQQVAVA